MTDLIDIIEIYKKWSEKSIIDEVILIAVIIAIIEAIAQNLLKNSDNYNNTFFFGLTFYILVGFLLHHAYKNFKMYKVNVIWSCLSIIIATVLGYVIYKENMTIYNFISVGFAVLAVIFSSLNSS